jgi:hypothetical protein
MWRLVALLFVASACFAQTTVVNGWGGSGGGSTSPGSPVNSVQFNDAGAFGGAPVHAATPAELAGVDLLTNGNFSSGLAGWTISGDGTGWTIVGGQAHHIPGSNDNFLEQTVNITQRDVYLMQVTVVSQTAGSSYMNLGDGCNSDCSHDFVVGVNTYPATACCDSGPTVIQFVTSVDSDVTVSLAALVHSEPLLYLPALGSSNVANGTSALFSSTTGSSNVANGAFALFSSTTGSSNVANGASALYSNTIGSSNVANGTSALYANTGFYNTADGESALSSNTTGGTNVAVGWRALRSNTTASDSTAVGADALFNSRGQQNVALGQGALYDLTTGYSNIAIGNAALAYSVTGNDQIGIMTGNGSNGCTDTRGTQYETNYSVFIGPCATTGTNSDSGTPLTNVVAINGIATGSNQMVLGNSATTNTFLFGVVNQPLHTPASSSEACTSGDHADDASFHYVCTATNTWKRVALNSF